MAKGSTNESIFLSMHQCTKLRRKSKRKQFLTTILHKASRTLIIQFCYHASFSMQSGLPRLSERNRSYMLTNKHECFGHSAESHCPHQAIVVAFFSFNVLNGHRNGIPATPDNQALGAQLYPFTLAPESSVVLLHAKNLASNQELFPLRSPSDFLVPVDWMRRFSDRGHFGLSAERFKVFFSSGFPRFGEPLSEVLLPLYYISSCDVVEARFGEISSFKNKIHFF